MPNSFLYDPHFLTFDTRGLIQGSLRMKGQINITEVSIFINGEPLILPSTDHPDKNHQE